MESRSYLLSPDPRNPGLFRVPRTEVHLLKLVEAITNLGIEAEYLGTPKECCAYVLSEWQINITESEASQIIDRVNVDHINSLRHYNRTIQ